MKNLNNKQKNSPKIWNFETFLKRSQEVLGKHGISVTDGMTDSQSTTESQISVVFRPFGRDGGNFNKPQESDNIKRLENESSNNNNKD